jgi:ribosomal protein S12 methylthiotransferase accessory factor
MSLVTCPYPNGRWLIKGGLLECRRASEIIQVRAPTELLERLFHLCDGLRTTTEIAAELASAWEVKTVRAFLEHLDAIGVICEAGNALAESQKLAWLPGIGRPLGEVGDFARIVADAGDRLPARGTAVALPVGARPLLELLRARESLRTFADRPLAWPQLQSILWAAYGVCGRRTEGVPRRVVPSAGGFYQLRWLVGLLKPAGRIAAGLYEASFARDGGVSLRRLAGDCADLWHLLGDPRILTFAQAVVFPVADLEVIARKYRNRALLYAAIEVGHCLQNAALIAVKCEVAACVRGDVIEARVVETFSLSGGTFPTVALIVGSRPSTRQLRAAQTPLEVRWNWGGAVSMRHPVAMAEAQAGPAFFAGAGRDALPARAIDKAEAEAWERLGWSRPQKLTGAKFTELQGALDPREVVAYAPWQYDQDGFGFRPFSPRKRYSWIKGVAAATGVPVWVPAQCACALSGLPAAESRAPFTNASSSGTAAGVSLQEALRRGVLELIERDALCTAWAARATLPRLASSRLPGELQRRLRALEERECKVAVVCLAADLMPVIGVAVRCAGRFTCLATGAGFALEDAIVSALSEAELCVEKAFALPGAAMRPEDVRDPEGHGDFHADPGRRPLSDFLFAGPAMATVASLAAACARSWAQLEGRLREAGLPVICVDLTPRGAAIHQGRTPIHVARAVVPGLVPIWFGYRAEPLGLARLQTALARRRGYAYAPEDFIHPLR